MVDGAGHADGALSGVDSLSTQQQSPISPPCRLAAPLANLASFGQTKLFFTLSPPPRARAPAAAGAAQPVPCCTCGTCQPLWRWGGPAGAVRVRGGWDVNSAARTQKLFFTPPSLSLRFVLFDRPPALNVDFAARGWAKNGVLPRAAAPRGRPGHPGGHHRAPARPRAALCGRATGGPLSFLGDAAKREFQCVALLPTVRGGRRARRPRRLLRSRVHEPAQPCPGAAGAAPPLDMPSWPRLLFGSVGPLFCESAFFDGFL